MVILHITRHGQTEWNLEKRMQGWLDSPLTEIGEKSAIALGKRLESIPFQAVYTSPSGRTMETTKLICQKRKIPIISAEQLKEINAGEWQGLTADEIQAIFPTQYKMYYEDAANYYSQQGENFHEVLQRSLSLISTIQKNYKEDEHVLLVTHAVVKKLLICHFKKQTIDHVWQPPFIHGTSLTIIHLKNDGDHNLELVGDTAHLKNIG